MHVAAPRRYMATGCIHEHDGWQAFSLREELHALRARHESATSESHQAQALLTTLGDAALYMQHACNGNAHAACMQ